MLLRMRYFLSTFLIYALLFASAESQGKPGKKRDNFKEDLYEGEDSSLTGKEEKACRKDEEKLITCIADGSYILDLEEYAFKQELIEEYHNSKEYKDEIEDMVDPMAEEIIADFLDSTELQDHLKVVLEEYNQTAEVQQLVQERVEAAVKNETELLKTNLKEEVRLIREAEYEALDLLEQIVRGLYDISVKERGAYRSDIQVHQHLVESPPTGPPGGFLYTQPVNDFPGWGNTGAPRPAFNDFNYFQNPNSDQRMRNNPEELRYHAPPRVHWNPERKYGVPTYDPQYVNHGWQQGPNIQDSPMNGNPIPTAHNYFYDPFNANGDFRYNMPAYDDVMHGMPIMPYRLDSPTNPEPRYNQPFDTEESWEGFYDYDFQPIQMVDAPAGYMAAPAHNHAAHNHNYGGTTPWNAGTPWNTGTTRYEWYSTAGTRSYNGGGVGGLVNQPGYWDWRRWNVEPTTPFIVIAPWRPPVDDQPKGRKESPGKKGLDVLLGEHIAGKEDSILELLNVNREEKETDKEDDSVEKKIRQSNNIMLNAIRRAKGRPANPEDNAEKQDTPQSDDVVNPFTNAIAEKVDEDRTTVWSTSASDPPVNGFPGFLLNWG